MKILCIYRHYVPDTAPYGTILKVIAEHLAGAGHQVSVVTAYPTYNEQVRERLLRSEEISGVKVTRLPLLPERRSWKVVRAINVGLFQFQAFLFAVLKRRKFSVVLVNSTPPIASGFTAKCLKLLTGQRFFYHCQDIHPEAMRVSGILNNGLILKALRSIDRSTCLSADQIIAISEDMRETLLDRKVPGQNISVIPNFGIYEPQGNDLDCKLSQRVSPETFDILFAGNLGNFQNLDLAVEAALRLEKEAGIRWLFMGEGAAKKRLQALAGSQMGKTIFFLPYQPTPVAFQAMCKANLGLVSLGNEIFRVAFPSKTAMYMEAGCPILAVVEERSQLSRMVERHGLGYTCEPDSAEELASVVLRAYQERAQWTRERRQKIRVASHKIFGREHILAQWRELFENAASSDR
jgi:glycosyltransferase involved in cell wall biosynthesis